MRFTDPEIGLAACNGDADCAELAVSRIAEHVKTYEAMIQCVTWPRRSAVGSWATVNESPSWATSLLYGPDAIRRLVCRNCRSDSLADTGRISGISHSAK